MALVVERSRPRRPPFFKEATCFSPSAVGLEEYGEAHVATIQIYDLASRVHEPEGQRLEIGPTANNVVLLVLGHVQNLTAEAMALRVHLFCRWCAPLAGPACSRSW